MPGDSSSACGPRPGRGTRRPRSWPSPRSRRSTRTVGRDQVEISIGYVGLIPSSYPINAIHQWTGGPEEAILRVALKQGAEVDIERLKERLRQELAEQMPDVRLSFEPADIVSGVMSFGSPTPVEVAVTGPNLADDRAFAEKLRAELAQIRVAPRPAVWPGARLPDDRRRDRPRARGAERRHGPGRGPLGGRGHIVQPLRGPQLLARPQDRHRLPGPGRDSVPGHGLDRGGGDGADPEAGPRPASAASRRRAGPPGDDARRVRPLQHEAHREPDGQHRRRGPGPGRRPRRAARSHGPALRPRG